MKYEPNNPFMRETRRHRSSSAGELPAEFDRRLVELDQKLSRQAASEPVPPQLADGVFRASVSRLPAGRETAPLRFPRRVPRPVWGQLAMAASVALACMVGVWFHHSPSAPSVDDSFVHRTLSPSGGTTDLAGSAIESTPLDRVGHDVELLSPDAMHLLLDGGSDYLIDTRDLTHAQAVDDLYRVYEHLSEL